MSDRLIADIAARPNLFFKISLSEEKDVGR